MNDNPLVPVSIEEADATDELLSALSDLAYSEAPVLLTPEKKRHKSRFFFHITRSLATEVSKRSKKFSPKKLEHVDDVIVNRLRDYKDEIPSQLSANIGAVREFFLTKVAPLTLAGGAGATQARDIVQRLLGTEIEGSQIDRFDRMSHTAVNLSMAAFVAKYYGLPKGSAQKLIDSITPRLPTHISFPNVSPNHDKNSSQGKETNSRK